MNIIDLKNDLVTSLKKGESVRVETLRFLLAAVSNMAIEKYGAKGDASLSDTDIIDVVKKQVKTHKESIIAFVNAKRQDLVNKEQAQLAILQSFFPAEMTDDDLKKTFGACCILRRNQLRKTNGTGHGTCQRKSRWGKSFGDAKGNVTT